MRRFVFCVACGWAIATSAAAQTSGPDRTPSATQANAADDEARGLFLAGKAAFEDGRFEDALNYFREAYQLSRRPALLYNIGITADRLRRDDEALAAFDQYLRLVPGSPERPDVQARVHVLRERAEAQRTRTSDTQREVPEAPTATTPTSPKAEPRTTPKPLVPPRERGTADRGPGMAPWAVIGAGGATAITGAVLLVLGETAASNVEDAKRGSTWSSVSDDADKAPTLSTAGGICLGLGVLGAAAGIAWLVLDDEDSSVETRVGVGPGVVQMVRTF